MHTDKHLTGIQDNNTDKLTTEPCLTKFVTDKYNIVRYFPFKHSLTCNWLSHIQDRCQAELPVNWSGKTLLSSSYINIEDNRK